LISISSTHLAALKTGSHFESTQNRSADTSPLLLLLLLLMLLLLL
jgi:hypothetical protein